MSWDHGLDCPIVNHLADLECTRAVRQCSSPLSTQPEGGWPRYLAVCVDV